MLYPWSPEEGDTISHIPQLPYFIVEECVNTIGVEMPGFFGKSAVLDGVLLGQMWRKHFEADTGESLRRERNGCTDADTDERMLC